VEGGENIAKKAAKMRRHKKTETIQKKYKQYRKEGIR
jgi:hypothetical protein